MQTSVNAGDLEPVPIFQGFDAGYQAVNNLTQAQSVHGFSLFRRELTCDPGYGYCSSKFFIAYSHLSRDCIQYSNQGVHNR